LLGVDAQPAAIDATSAMKESFRLVEFMFEFLSGFAAIHRACSAGKALSDHRP
jgi:hypothetical protein